MVYWMVAARRTFWNPALERAASWSRTLGLPLLVAEPLRLRPDRATRRFHRFLLDGMATNARRLSFAGVLYHPFVESPAQSASGLPEALARRAAVWITDDEPSTDLADTNHRGIGASLPLKAEAVRSESIAAEPSPFASLDGHRLALRRGLLSHFQEFPGRNPLARYHEPTLPSVLPHVGNGWPAASGALLAGDRQALEALALDPPDAFPEGFGGSEVGAACWRELIGGLTGADSDGTPRPLAGRAGSGPGDGRIPAVDAFDAPPPTVYDLADTLAAADAGSDRYALLRYHLAAGHLSGFQVLVESLRHSRWTPERLGPDPAAGPEWWGLPGGVARLVASWVEMRDARLARDAVAPESSPNADGSAGY